VTLGAGGPPIVDAHAHHLPRRLLEFIGQAGEPYGVRAVLGNDDRWEVQLGTSAARVVPPPLVADDRCVGQMPAQDLDVRILSGWNELFGYELEARSGLWWCRAQNDHLAELISEHSDMLCGLATIPLQDPDQAAAEVRRATNELGLCGVIVGTQVRQANLDEPELDPVWASASECDVPVVVHPGSASLGGERMSRYFLANTVGNPTETTLAAAALIFGGVLERFPELRVLLVHGGGFLPYQLGRLQKSFDVRPEVPKGTAREPRLAARRFYYDTILHEPTALEHLIRFAGADRLLFGTDFPFEMAENRSPNETLPSDVLDARSRAAVAGENAVALFRLRAADAAS
jgi:aminocarboxymuconate-semialdehyde decarboxylase